MHRNIGSAQGIFCRLCLAQCVVSFWPQPPPPPPKKLIIFGLSAEKSWSEDSLRFWGDIKTKTFFYIIYFYFIIYTFMDKNYSNEMEVKEVLDWDNIVAQLVNCYADYRNNFRNFKITFSNILKSSFVTIIKYYTTN